MRCQYNRWFFCCSNRNCNQYCRWFSLISILVPYPRYSYWDRQWTAVELDRRWHFTSYSYEYTMIWYKLHQPMIRSEIVSTSPFHVLCCVFGERNFPAFKISDCFQMDLRRNWANPNDKLKMIASSIEQHVKCNK